jgi:hypothetical protein
VLQDERVGRGAAVVGLDIVGVERDSLVCVLDCEAVCFDLQVGLWRDVNECSRAAIRLHTCARLV